MQQDTFLVRFSGRYYFISRIDGKPAGTMIPSMARFLTYEAAIQVVRALRALGFEDSVVCTTRGWVAMPEDLYIQDRTVEEEFLAAWGPEPTQEVKAEPIQQ